MTGRRYMVVIAKRQGGLAAVAGAWTILENTVREFDSLVSNDDQQLGDIGYVNVVGSGWVALAYTDSPDQP